MEDFLAKINFVKKNNYINHLERVNKKNEENLRAMTKGIVIPGKEISISEGEEEENRFKASEQEESWFRHLNLN